MEDAPALWPDRKYTRLYGYDYSATGYYAVTLCTFRKQYLFGEVVDAEMRLSPLGQLVNDELLRIPSRFDGVQLDAHIVMPNHTHQVLQLEGGGYKLGTIVGCYKNRVALIARKHFGETTLWQRNYYDHVIRGEPSLDKHRGYLEANPGQWDLDELNRKNWNKFIEHNPNIAWERACL
jgi:putative transposase